MDIHMKDMVRSSEDMLKIKKGGQHEEYSQGVVISQIIVHRLDCLAMEESGIGSAKPKELGEAARSN